ncbi:MAG: deoxyribodipyrimidine photo-lyase [Pseudomonadota bacterium]
MQRLSLVWFKRDLRVHDHAALCEAAREGAVLPVFVVEPRILGADDGDALHYGFIRECLLELRESLAAMGQPLRVFVGETVDIFEALRTRFGFTRIYAHQETGNALTYARDLAVLDWARTNGIEVCEFAQHGVVRRLQDRNGWARQWRTLMDSAQYDLPDRLTGPPVEDIGDIPTGQNLGLTAYHPAVATRSQVQRGGEQAAIATLESFLRERGQHYQRQISSPSSAYRHGSRISAYLAYGALSLRRTVQQTEHSDLPARARRSFTSRLHWHCHFMQKLESQPSIESRCFNPCYESLRDDGNDPLLLQSWQQGLTGFPFVDACIRSLQTHGWINFRMRAMLVSFAAYDLWLDWRLFSSFLARQFLDYEPGIHLSQVQMQSGTTGINTPRMYNPVKQGFDHDPHAQFIRRWVPELAALPTPFVHEPWALSPIEAQAAEFRPGVDYPLRCVDHRQAIRRAREQIAVVRRSGAHRGAAARVFDQHGSRRAQRDRMTSNAYRERRLKGSDAPRFDAPKDEGQLTLFD